MRLLDNTVPSKQCAQINIVPRKSKNVLVSHLNSSKSEIIAMLGQPAIEWMRL